MSKHHSSPEFQGQNGAPPNVEVAENQLTVNQRFAVSGALGLLGAGFITIGFLHLEKHAGVSVDTGLISGFSGLGAGAITWLTAQKL